MKAILFFSLLLWNRRISPEHHLHSSQKRKRIIKQNPTTDVCIVCRIFPQKHDAEYLLMQKQYTQYDGTIEESLRDSSVLSRRVFLFFFLDEFRLLSEHDRRKRHDQY